MRKEQSGVASLPAGLSQAYHIARSSASSSPHRPRGARTRLHTSACSGTRCWGAVLSTRWPHMPHSRAVGGPHRGTQSGSFAKQGDRYGISLPWVTSKEEFNSEPNPSSPRESLKVKIQLQIALIGNMPTQLNEFFTTL